MKATGIVRRIDELGRVVVPKEIRRTLRIREGDPLLTTLTQCQNTDKQGGCGDFVVSGSDTESLDEEKICRMKRELFALGMVGLAERVARGNK